MEYKDQTFKDQVIVLDAMTFTRCTFRGCVIVFRGTSLMILRGCKFIDGCEYRVEGDALATLGRLADLYLTGESGRAMVEAIFEDIRQDRIRDTPRSELPGSKGAHITLAYLALLYKHGGGSRILVEATFENIRHNR